MMRSAVSIIARTNGVGLDRDVRLVRETLEAAGREVVASHCRGRGWWKGILPGRAEFQANIFLERIFPRWRGSAEVSFLIPNQERFPERQLGLLKREIDHVLVKSRHAEEVFSRHHGSVHYIGFTSESPVKNFEEAPGLSFVHLAGRSTLKGTEEVLKVWGRHPEWPELTLIQCEENAPSKVPGNVKLVTRYLEDEDIRRLYREHEVHLCPSRSEGWGHYLVEPMLAGRLVVTTDGPPMNELVTAERGILVPFGKSEPRHLGVNYFVEAEALERAVEGVLEMEVSERRRLALGAREWALENDQKFRERLGGKMRELLG